MCEWFYYLLFIFFYIPIFLFIHLIYFALICQHLSLPCVFLILLEMLIPCYLYIYVYVQFWGSCIFHPWLLLRLQCAPFYSYILYKCAWFTINERMCMDGSGCVDICMCVYLCVCVSIVLPSTPSTLPGLTDSINSSPSNHADEKLQFTLYGEVK